MYACVSSPNNDATRAIGEKKRGRPLQTCSSAAFANATGALWLKSDAAVGDSSRAHTTSLASGDDELEDQASHVSAPTRVFTLGIKAGRLTRSNRGTE